MAGSVAQAVALVVGQLAKAAATIRTVKGWAQAVGAVRGRGWRVTPLVTDERPRALKGLVADKADKEGVAQVGLDKVLRVLPLHVSLLELLIGEGDQAVEALIGPEAI